MSIGYSQSMQLTPTNLISENNQLRIELERLQNENQNLKQKPPQGGQAEAQINALIKENQFLINERNNLLNQVKAGSSSPNNFNDLKKQVELLLQENDRLNSIINEKNKEIETYKTKLQSGEPSLITQLELENRLVVLSTDNERFRALLADRNREIEALRKFKNEGNESNDFYSINAESTELKERCKTLTNELERLNILYNEKERELEDTKRQLKMINSTSNPVLEQYNRIDMEREEYEDQIQQLEQEKDSFRLKVEDLKIRNETLESKLERTYEEHEGLRGEIEFWKKKYNTLITELPETQRGEPQEMILKEENSQLKTLILEQNVQIANLRETCDELDTVLANKEGAIKEYERKFGLLLAENERVNKILMQKKKEFEVLQAKAQKAADLQEKIAILVVENQNIMGSLADLKRECESWKAKCISFQEGHTPTAHMTRMEEKIAILEDENDRLKNKERVNLTTIDSMQQKLEYLEKRLEEKSKESYISTGKNTALENAELRIKELETKLSLYIRENEVLVNEFVEKEKEMESLRREIDDLRFVESKFTELQDQVERIVEENHELKNELEIRDQEIERLRERTKGYQDKNQIVADLEERLQNVTSEKMRMGDILRNKEDEHLSLKTSYVQLEKEFGRSMKTEKTVGALKEENEALKDEIHEKDREIDILRKKLDKLSEQSVRLKELEVNLEIKRNEIAKMSEVLREREEEIVHWKERLEETEKRIDKYEDLEGKEQGLRENIRRLQEALNEKNREMEGVGTLRGEMSRMKEKLEAALMQKVLGNALNESLRISLDDLSEKNSELQGRFKAVKDVYLKELKGLGDKLDELERNNQILRDEVATKDEELEYYKDKYESAQKVETYMGEFEGRLKLLSEENESRATEVRQRTNEIEMLRKTASEYEKEISNLRMKVFEYESTDKGTLFDIEEQKKTLYKENERLLRQTQESYREIEKLKTRGIQLEKTEKKYEEVQGKLVELTNEKGRLDLVLMEREYEIGTWQDKCDTLEKKSNSKITQLEKKIESLESEIDRLNRTIKEYERDMKLFKDRGLELESNQGFNEGDQSYILRFGGQSSIKKKNRSVYEGRYRVDEDRTAVELVDENNRLGKELNEKAFEFENLREKYELLQKGLAERVIELEEEVQRLTQEKEEMNTLHVSTDIRDRSVEKKKSSGYRQFDQNENDFLRKENEEWKQKFQTLKETSQTIIEELANQVKSLQGEKSNLPESQKSINGHKEKNVLRSRGTNQSLEMFQLQEKLIQALSENDKLEKENSQLKKEDSSLKLKEQYTPTQRDSKRLTDLLDEKSKEIDKLKAQISGLQTVISQYKSFKERYENLERENQRLLQNVINRDSPDSRENQIRLVLQGNDNNRIREDDSRQNDLIRYVLLCSEIERLHLILFEINETHQEQIEKINVEWERLVDAYKERMGDLETENDELRLKLMGATTARY